MNLITKAYPSLVIGYPNALFPLDGVLFGVVAVAIGTILLSDWDFLIAPIPEANEKRTNVAGGIFGTILLLVALYGFAAFFYSFIAVDWAHGHIPFIIISDIIFLVPSAMILVNKFYLLNVAEEYRAHKTFLFSCVCLVVNVVLFAVYLIIFSNDLSAPNDALFGILPVEFTASANAFTYIYGLALIVAPIVTLIRSLLEMKKAK